MSFNAAGTLGSDESLHAFLISCSSVYVSWDVIFLQEVDFVQQSLDSHSFVDGHSIYKH